MKKSLAFAFVAFLFATSLSFGQVQSRIDSLTMVNGWKMIGRSADLVGGYSHMVNIGNPFYWAQPSQRSQAFCVRGNWGSWMEYEKTFSQEYTMLTVFLFLSYAPASNGGNLGNMLVSFTFSDINGDNSFQIMNGQIALWDHYWSSWYVNIDLQNVGRKFQKIKIRFELSFQTDGIIWLDNMGPSLGSNGYDPIVENFEDTTIVGVEDETAIPTNFTLFQNYPNPFNPETVIRFELKSSEFVKLTIFDILGREVATLVDEEKYPGNYEVVFNASNLPSGTYFYRLETKGFSETKKMTLIK